jgi:hypothetical protein
LPPEQALQRRVSLRTDLNPGAEISWFLHPAARRMRHPDRRIYPAARRTRKPAGFSIRQLAG